MVNIDILEGVLEVQRVLSAVEHQRHQVPVATDDLAGVDVADALQKRRGIRRDEFRKAEIKGTHSLKGSRETTVRLDIAGKYKDNYLHGHVEVGGLSIFSLYKHLLGRVHQKHQTVPPTVLVIH